MPSGVIIRAFTVILDIPVLDGDSRHPTLQSVEDRMRKLVERCDRFGGTVLMHSLAGGTGAGEWVLIKGAPPTSLSLSLSLSLYTYSSETVLYYLILVLWLKFSRYG